MSIDAIEHVRQTLLENMQRLESIAKNVSNMRTNGYKSVDFVTALQGNEVVGSAVVNDAAGQAMSVQNNNSIYVDDGYLVTQDKSSLELQQLKSTIHSVNEEGALVTDQGRYLLGESGIIFTTSDYHIDDAGQVVANGQVVDQLRLVDAQQQAMSAATRKVSSGMAEASNVAYSQEVVAASEALSAVRTANSLVARYDSLLAMTNELLRD